VGVLAYEERAVDSLAAAELADGLGDGHDARLVERAVERRAAVAAGSAAHGLTEIARIRLAVVVRAKYSCSRCRVRRTTARLTALLLLPRLGRPLGRASRLPS
jgi:hypothetical protein